MLWNLLKQKMLDHPQSMVIQNGIALTYQEIISYVENFAVRLEKPCYAVLCKYEMFEAIAILSCFAAEKTVVPLSQRYGSVHCKRILTAIQPGYVISDVNGELDVTALDEQGYTEPEKHPALIMCTSGTTGIPKGAMISEESLICNLNDIIKYFKINSDDNIMIIRPIYHCAVLTGEFLTSLMLGLSIHFYDEPFNPMKILDYAIKNEISVMCGTPTLFGTLARFNIRNHKRFEPRCIALSGECLTEKTAKTIRSAFSDTNIYNVYGLTEASPRVSYLPPELFDNHPESVGYILASLKTRIVDESGKELEHNKIGELEIFGVSVMSGYYNDRIATEAAMNNGWLRTGDLAYIDENGLIYIKGRKDNMIIRAGINIYPQEIENALKSDSRVKEVLAYGVDDSRLGQSISIDIVGDFSDISEVSVLCRRVLPEYEQPQSINIVDNIAKNASGKIIRRK